MGSGVSESDVRVTVNTTQPLRFYEDVLFTFMKSVDCLIFVIVVVDVVAIAIVVYDHVIGVGVSVDVRFVVASSSASLSLRMFVSADVESCLHVS